MLSIIDLLDFMDLDKETVQIVNDAARVSDAEATEMARGLLTSEQGIQLLHAMFRDQLVAATEHGQLGREKHLRKSYAYFCRKSPMPGLA